MRKVRDMVAGLLCNRRSSFTKLQEEKKQLPGEEYSGELFFNMIPHGKGKKIIHTGDYTIIHQGKFHYGEFVKGKVLHYHKNHSYLGYDFVKRGWRDLGVITDQGVNHDFFCRLNRVEQQYQDSQSFPTAFITTYDSLNDSRYSGGARLDKNNDIIFHGNGGRFKRNSLEREGTYSNGDIEGEYHTTLYSNRGKRIYFRRENSLESKNAISVFLNNKEIALYEYSVDNRYFEDSQKNLYMIRSTENYKNIQIIQITRDTGQINLYFQ